MAEAAAALGVSARAIRARIQRGTLAAYAVRVPGGFTYRVPVEAVKAGTPEGIPRNSEERGIPGVERVPASWERERTDLVAQVEWLRGQVEAHQQEATEQRAHASELARLLESEQHPRAAIEARIIRALPAPPAEPEGVTIEQEQQQPAEAKPELRRRWWHFRR